MSQRPNDRPKTWFEEFSAEVKSDHHQLLECREKRQKNGDWSFEHALKRTQAFYRERFTGYCKVGSISQNQLDQLMPLVEALGSADFPED